MWPAYLASNKGWQKRHGGEDRLCHVEMKINWKCIVVIRLDQSGFAEERPDNAPPSVRTAVAQSEGGNCHGVTYHG